MTIEDTTMTPDSAIKLAAEMLRPFLKSAAQDPDVKKVMESRDTVLERYQRMLRPEYIPTLTADEFQRFLRFDNNCHWTGLHRKTAHVCDDLARLKSALSTLLDEGQPVASRVDRLLPMAKPKFIKGFGKAVVTAVLHVAHPEKYGVWNGTSEKGMRTLRVWPTFQRGATDGDRYEQINTVLNRLAKAMDVDLWTLDALWWQVKVLAFSPIPEEVLTPERYKEGAIRTISVNAYERNSAARQKCIHRYGLECAVCKASMADLYGDVAKGIIHIHHLNELAAIGEEYEVDPINDLRPVCPNCHAVLHSTSPVMNINELEKILAKHRKRR